MCINAPAKYSNRGSHFSALASLKLAVWPSTPPRDSLSVSLRNKATEMYLNLQAALDGSAARLNIYGFKGEGVNPCILSATTASQRSH